MRCKRITLSAWTCSFRYPAFIVGYQPSLPVPPVSTLYGLISAAVGEWITPDHVDIGYVFESHGTCVDLEAAYELSERLGFKQNVYKREFLFEPTLYLYVQDDKIAEAFRRPAYPLVLVRSSDIAMVTAVDDVELASVEGPITVCGTLLPQSVAGRGVITQALPTHFSEDIPRRALGTRVFSIVNKKLKVSSGIDYADPEHGWGVYFHG